MLSGVNAKAIAADGVVSASADKVVSALYDVILSGGDSGEGFCTIAIYDGPSAAAGDLIIVLKVAAEETDSLGISSPIAINNGNIFLDITGTNASAVVLWK